MASTTASRLPLRSCTSRASTFALSSKFNTAPTAFSSFSPSAFSSFSTKTARSVSRSQARRAFQQQSRRAYSSSGGGSNSGGGIKFLPFVALIGVAFGTYAMVVNKRVGTAPPKSDNMPVLDPLKTSGGQLPPPAKSTPTFSPDNTTVVFVLGGPGAGKGTQCANLVEHHAFTHLSAGDLLRAEQQRPGSQFGQLIRDYIKDGLIVPMEVTIQLLENAMTETINSSKDAKGPGATHKFLIDGFPRKMDQAVKFEESVCPAKVVLFYDCPEEEMERRLLERGKTSGRSDDNAESIRKRFRTFVETSMPVVDAFEKQGKVVRITATETPEKVYAKTKTELTKFMGDKF